MNCIGRQAELIEFILGHGKNFTHLKILFHKQLLFYNGVYFKNVFYEFALKIDIINSISFKTS